MYCLVLLLSSAVVYIQSFSSGNFVGLCVDVMNVPASSSVLVSAT